MLHGELPTRQFVSALLRLEIALPRAIGHIDPDLTRQQRSRKQGRTNVAGLYPAVVLGTNSNNSTIYTVIGFLFSFMSSIDPPILTRFPISMPYFLFELSRTGTRSFPPEKILRPPMAGSLTVMSVANDVGHV
jgi:hypothetical protein